jgi:hypothetical protein
LIVIYLRFFSAIVLTDRVFAPFLECVFQALKFIIMPPSYKLQDGLSPRGIVGGDTRLARQYYLLALSTSDRCFPASEDEVRAEHLFPMSIFAACKDG